MTTNRGKNHSQVHAKQKGFQRNQLLWYVDLQDRNWPNHIESIMY